jgi:hypothetical protein
VDSEALEEERSVRRLSLLTGTEMTEGLVGGGRGERGKRAYLLVGSVTANIEYVSGAGKKGILASANVCETGLKGVCLYPLLYTHHEALLGALISYLYIYFYPSRGEFLDFSTVSRIIDL